MQPNFLFLLAASNANFKPGGLLKWKRLEKDARLLLSLTEVIKIDRLISLPLDIPRLSSPKQRVRQSTQCACLFLLNQYILLSVLLLVLFPPVQIFPLVLVITPPLPRDGGTAQTAI